MIDQQDADAVLWLESAPAVLEAQALVDGCPLRDEYVYRAQATILREMVRDLKLGTHRAWRRKSETRNPKQIPNPKAPNECG